MMKILIVALSLSLTIIQLKFINGEHGTAPADGKVFRR